MLRTAQHDRVLPRVILKKLAFEESRLIKILSYFVRITDEEDYGIARIEEKECPTLERDISLHQVSSIKYRVTSIEYQVSSNEHREIYSTIILCTAFSPVPV